MKKKVVKGVVGGEAAVVAILNKWSEPKALLAAWIQLSKSSQREEYVISVIRSVLSGRDVRMKALEEFLSQCEAESIPVVVESKNYGARPFKVEENGTAYTPGSKESPIKRRPGESKQDFFRRWDQHRNACISRIANDILEDGGTSLEAVRKIASDSITEVEANMDLSLWEIWADTIAKWVMPREQAERLIKGDDSGVEVESSAEPVHATGTVTVSADDLRALFDEIRHLHSKVDALSEQIATPKPEATNVIPFRPRVQHLGFNAGETDFFGMSPHALKTEVAA